MKKQKGFTLIELLVVIAIIGLLASIIIVTLGNARARARDSKRLADMRQILIALEMFYHENDRYPNNSDGISGSGECIGDGVDCGNSGNPSAFENAIRPYLANVPPDPAHNCPDASGNCVNDPPYYFYAYDYSHSGCDPVISFRQFETSGMRNKHGRRDTTSGSDMDIDDSEYVVCLELD